MTNAITAIIRRTDIIQSDIAFDEVDEKGRTVGCAVTQYTETVLRIMSDDDLAQIRREGCASLGEGFRYAWVDAAKRPIGTITHHFNGRSTRNGLVFGGTVAGENDSFTDDFDRDQAAIAYVAAARKRSAAKAKKAAKA